ncbi:hypothetical protein [Mesorhizobium sp. B2-3-5]|uniref:hypothetical protein n=1 Tax=Mesorhizobium sp. B2-3-5 TaxID=2589958 RepID=UPI0015E37AA4|nr:hypothetical protein [Mesorhizobium sp. B2-3-5]
MGAGPLLLVRSAPRLRLGSFMPDIKASANRASFQKYAIYRRDFSQGGIHAASFYKKRQLTSEYPYGVFHAPVPTKH